MKELNDLTDLEICKEIARIEDVSEKTRYRKPRYRGRDGEYLYIDRSNEEFSPLTDWNITGPLMVKYEVNSLIDSSGYMVWADIKNDNDPDPIVCEDLHRAICLAIIAQHRLKGDTE